MRIGILTGGGDAPGLNGIIESASKALLNAGCEIVGICDGFEGIFDGKVKKLPGGMSMDSMPTPGLSLEPPIAVALRGAKRNL